MGEAQLRMLQGTDLVSDLDEVPSLGEECLPHFTLPQILLRILHPAKSVQHQYVHRGCKARDNRRHPPPTQKHESLLLQLDAAL